MALRILHNIYIKYYIIYIHTRVKIYKHVTICTYPISLVEKGVRMCCIFKKMDICSGGGYGWSFRDRRTHSRYCRRTIARYLYSELY